MVWFQVWMLSWGLKSSDPAARIAAAVALGKTGHRRAVKPLVAALRDPSLEVWMAAHANLEWIQVKAEIDGDAGTVAAITTALAAARPPAGDV